MPESPASTSWRPTPTNLVAGALVLAGFGLSGLSWWFLLLTAAGTFGPGLLRAKGKAGMREDSVFQDEGLDPEVEQTPYRDVHLKGERRSYRFPLQDVSVADDPAGLRLRFELPRGCYATTVLAEIMKTDALPA